MPGYRTLLVAACLLGCLVTTSAAEDPWLGKPVMPKGESTMLSTNRQYTGSIYDISWPAVVTRVDGQWLWLSDTSGLSQATVSGWVRKNEVVLLDRADAYYASELRSTPQPVLHWLRGICWESRGETAPALREYLTALASRPDLADAELRAARIESYATSNDRPWITRFDRATRMMGSRPRAHYEYAEAHRRLYQAWVDTETNSSTFDATQQAEKIPAPTKPVDADAAARLASADFTRASELYETAMRNSREWPMASMGLGQLLLAKATWQAQQSNVDADRQKNLSTAISYFDNAILANPKNVDAYRQRGEAYRQMHNFSLAKLSAHRACELTDYRQPRSLATLASIYADLSDFEHAATYANKAGLYASDDIRHAIVEQRNQYVMRVASNDVPMSTSIGSETTKPVSEHEKAARKAEMFFPRFVPRPLSAAE